MLKILCTDKVSKRLFLKVNEGLLLLCLLLINLNSLGQPKKNELSVLFVGNSYIYYQNLPHIVSAISDSIPTKLITTKSTIGGARLSEHWHGKRGLKTKELIKSGKFDAVVLQEYSMGPIHQPDSLFKYAKLLCDLIKQNGAKPYFYLVWAREKVPQYQEDLTRVYLKASKINGADVIPVGPGWAMARKIRPNVPLYNADGSHPSSLGTFLTACIFVKHLTGLLPKKLPNTLHTLDQYNESIELMRLDPLDIQFAMKIANKNNFKQ